MNNSNHEGIYMKSNRQICTCRYWCAALMLLVALPLIAADDTRGWFKAGSHPEDYDMGVDRAVVFGGRPSGMIRSNKPDTRDFGTYMQMFNAEDYRGKRVQFSAMVKTENVEKWCSLWMRVDQDRQSIAFDNMQKRQIKGTTNWTRYSVVLNVDPKATAIAFGIMLAGKGAMWVNDVKFETVGPEVPVTDMWQEMHKLPSGPSNTNFDQK
jgi:hypothetical protein